MINHPRLLPIPHIIFEGQTALALGTDWTYTPALYTHIELINLSFILTTDATVANRYVVLHSTSGVDSDWVISCGYAHPASTAVRYSFIQGWPHDMTLPINGYLTMPLTMRWIATNPRAFETAIVNLQAGDQITMLRASFRQWIDPVLV